MPCSGSYTGIDNVEVTEVWRRLEQEPDAILIDVRTQAEWTFVGIPDLTKLGKDLVTIEWQGFPEGQVNPVFAEQLDAELVRNGVKKSASLFFICRSGVRSLHAAQVMAKEGYRCCHNVAAGFEGPQDKSRQRGTLGGWKAAGLPWIQS